MSMRISEPGDTRMIGGGQAWPIAACSALSLFAGACGRHDKTEMGSASQGILCRTRGEGEFRNSCTLDRFNAVEGRGLILRNPDGSFHRLQIVDDARALIAADGAEPAHVRISGDSQIEVAIGGDVYRLAATLKGREFKAP